MSQKCKHCGYEASDEEKYCPKCRNALDFAYKSETTQNAEKDLFALSKKAFIYSVLCMICAPLGAIAAAFFRGQLFLYSLSALLPWGAFFIVGIIYLWKSAKVAQKRFFVLALLLFLFSVIAIPTVWIPLRIYLMGTLVLF